MGGYEILLYEIASGLSTSNSIDVFTAVSQENIPPSHFRFVKVSPNYKFVNNKNIHNIIDSLRFNLHLRDHIEEINGYDLAIISTIPYYGYGNLMKKIKIKNGSIKNKVKI